MLSPELGSGHETTRVHLGGTTLAWSLGAHGQQPERIRRVGVLTPFTKQYFVDRNDVAAFTTEFQRAEAMKKAEIFILNTVR
jgi:hypothetical protein